MVATALVVLPTTQSAFAANPSADIDQCENGKAGDPPDQCAGTHWINGNLGAAKAHYAEGDNVPFRLKFDNLDTSISHTVIIAWDTTKSGKHAYDYLTTYNATEADADPCSNISGCANPTTFAIPPDPNVTNSPDFVPAQQNAGNFTLFNGTITGVSAYSLSGSYAGDSTTQISITFTTTAANPVLAWAGHISSRADWGMDNSAVAISGSPYHMRLIDLDGAGGNQDRSLSEDAVIFPGSITIIKDAVPDNAQDFVYNTTVPAGAPALVPSPFTLDDDPSSATPTNTQVFNDIETFGAYTVTETAVQGWTLGGIVCSVESANGGSTANDLPNGTVTITMKEGEQYTCTYTNNLQNGTLKVIKQVVGPASPSAFSMHVKQGANEVAGSPQPGAASPGTSYSLPPGSYTVSETTALLGYAADFSACGTAGVVTVNPGQTTTCTVVNTADTLSLDVQKTASPTSVNEPGGDVTFTVVVTNNSAEPVSITSLSDDVYGTLAGDADCKVGTVLAASGGNCQFSFIGPVAGDAGSTHTDTVTVHAQDDESRDVSDTDDATVTIVDVKPTIVVDKTASPTSVPEPGGNVTFTVKVTNTSIEDVTLTTLTDDVYGNLDGQGSCDVTPAVVLTPGGSYTCSFTGMVSGDAGSTHTDTATATAHDNELNDATDDDDATVTISNVNPGISVDKIATPGTVPEPGGNVTFKVTVTNDSIESVTIKSLVDDVYGPLTGDADCQVGTVLGKAGASDDSCQFEFTKLVTGDAGSVHKDTVTACADDNESNRTCDDDDATVTITDVAPSISVTKDADPTTMPEPGGNVTFTVKVTNNSVESVTIKSLDDDIYGPLTGDADCQVGTVLAAGASCDFSFTENVGPDAGAYTDVVTTCANDNENNQDCDDDDATVTVTDVLPTITVDKSVDPTSLPEPGGDATFTVKVTNNSVEPVTIQSLEDDVYGTLVGDDDCKVGTVLDPGQSCEFSFTESVGPDAGATTDVVTACAADNEENTDCDDDDATVTVTDVLPTITIDKSASPTTLPAGGGNATFTVKVTNNSVEPVTIKSLVDDIYGTLAGDDDCKVGTVLAAGASCEFSFTKQISGAGDHTDVVTVCASDNNGNDTCDDDNATVNVAPDEVLPEVLARTGPQEIQRMMAVAIVALGLGAAFLFFGDWTRRRMSMVSTRSRAAAPPAPPTPTYGRIEGGAGRTLRIPRRK